MNSDTEQSGSADPALHPLAGSTIHPKTISIPPFTTVIDQASGIRVANENNAIVNFTPVDPDTDTEAEGFPTPQKPIGKVELIKGKNGQVLGGLVYESYVKCVKFLHDDKGRVIAANVWRVRKE